MSILRINFIHNKYQKKGFLMRCDYKLLVIALSVINFACTPTKRELAFNDYQQAINEKNLPRVISTLTTLTNVEPEKYQTELNRFKQADEDLNNAEVHLKNSNFYLAYLSAHDSFHNFPSPKSKVILLTSGKVILKILRAESALNKYTETIPTSLKETVLSYSDIRTTDWDLVKLNKLLESINTNLLQLHKALAVIRKNHVNTYSQEFTLWEQSIQQKEAYVSLLKNHLINKGLSQSSIELQKLNQELITNTKDLLSLVREDMAIDALQPIFFKAQQDYQTYLITNENISLAASLGKRNQHSTWYEDWHQLEEDTLAIPSPLSDYIKNIKERTNKFNNYIKREQHSLASIESTTFTYNITTPNIVKSLIEKVKKDKTILLYGNAKK
jgi:hypothetical protein